MSAQDAVYPLAEPTEVDVPSIERELEEIWRCCAEAEGDIAVMRTAAFTLVYAVRDTHDSGLVQDMLVQLTLRHPARIILVRFGDEMGPPSMRASVTVYCHRPAPSVSPACVDFITLQSTGSDPSSAVSTLLSLFLSGMPTVLVWDSSLPPDHPVLLKLAPELERVIVSVIPPCSPASNLSTLFKLTDALGVEPLVTDLLECMVRSWQIAIANLFDADPAAAQATREIRLGFPGGKIPAEMLVLASWLSVVLKWKVKQITLHGHIPILLFAEDHAISFVSQPDASATAFAEFVTSSPQGDKTMRCDEPVSDNRLVELLHFQLQIWGRDPMRDESFRLARIWLKELLFS